ncbi:MAG: hypothetical protein JWM98_2510 [Thermoleophilia bacterium]|nr:hypothetical protein [Thermoleophilia bacterium]
MSALVEEGWIAPDRAGPTRPRTLACIGCVALALLIWGAVAARGLAEGFGRGSGPRRSIAVRIDGDGAIRGSRSEVRTSGTAKFVVSRRELTPSDDRVRVRIVAAAGVDATRVAMRVDAEGARVHVGHDADGVPQATVDAASGTRVRVLVSVPVRALASPPTTRSSGTLRSVTAPIDARTATDRHERDRLDRLRASWWWLLPLGLIPTVASLWLWRRAARRFRSMRLPGPGTDASTAPPSSLDPVGVAAIVAGARPVDAADAFAGHVLDLVERRQLRMRRTLDTVYGAGALIGLAQADDANLMLAEDPAVSLLRALAVDAGATVALPDAASRRSAVPEELRRAWRAHIAARVRFERLLEVPPRRRLGIEAGVASAVALVAIVTTLVVDGVGTRALAAYVAAVALPAALVLVAWWLETARWRRVVRTRRLERAQWRAWGEPGSDGAPSPASDIRNLPLLVASGHGGEMPTYVAVDAVGLRAATPATVATLRALIGDGDER